jgi:phage shock protein PspC (stress-responsive transcriptional regulator)
MQKVVGINLNGRAYHVEEAGYAALLAYLDRAGAALAGNPDRAEILADLEQAIAERCDRLLGPHRTVVAAAEMDQMLAEMGPVDAGDAATTADAGEKPGETNAAKGAASPKRLYRIREGAMFAGLCAGVAAFLDIDVTIVRVVFVVLAVLTKGVWVVVYGVLMFVIPYAETSEDHAAAHGRPFTAQALVDQAMRNIADLKSNKNWKRQWRRQQREWHRAWRHATAPHAWNAQAAYASHVWARSTAPVAGLINAALTLALLYALYSLTTTHAVFGVPLPDNVPLWAGIVIVLGLYQVIAIPFVAMQRVAAQPYPPGIVVWLSPAANLIWLAAIGFSMWYGYNHVPAVHDAIDKVVATLREAGAR